MNQCVWGVRRRTLTR